MLPDFRLEEFFGRWEFCARYHLTASDAETRTVGELLALAGVPSFDPLSLGYIPSEGGPALRTAVAATYQRVQADDVLCFCGAEEGLFCAMHALLSRDDHVIVTVPNYQSMEELPLSLAGEVSGLPLLPQHDWEVDLDQLRALLRPNTRLVCVNFPNNPTGKVLSPQLWHGLLEIVREAGIWLFSDEVYRGLERGSPLAQAADLYERALSLNVMSKAYGLPGLRVGWIACRDRAVLARMLKIKHYLSICNSAPGEWLATLALSVAEPLLERNRRIAKENLALWTEFFERYPGLFEWWEPEGGCVAFPRYLGRDGVENFCARLVEEAGVLLLPSSIYRSRLSAVCPDRFRLGYGRRNLAEGLAEMGKFLDRQSPGGLLQ